MPAQGTYFLNTTSFATATAIYTDSALTTAASNGWYKTSSNTFREQTGAPGSPVLSSTFTCECTTFSSSSLKSTSTLACAASLDQTFFHTGSGSTPVATNICYSDAGQTVLGNGFYKISTAGNGTYMQITGGSGVVSAVTSCPASVTSYSSSSVETTLIAACGATANQTYYHAGLGSTPLATNVCYSDSGTTVLGNGYYKVAPLSQNYNITVANVGAGNKYYINGVLQTTFVLSKGYTYTFNQTASTNTNHPFRLSTTSNGTHGGGVQYTSGWSDNGGTAGSTLISTFIVPANAPDTLYYYCQYHSGMGGQINIGAGSSQGTYAQITGGSGVVASVGAFSLGTSFSSSSIQTTSTLACAASIGQTYYHNGSGSAPVATDVCYSDACKSTVLGNGYYKISATGNGTYMQITGGSGVVSAVTSCPASVTSYSSSSVETTLAAACGSTVDETYYHTGSGLAPLATDICYSDSGTTVLGNGYYRVASLSQNYNITVANVGAGNKYYINGVLQTTFAISRGSTYTFNQSDSSNVSHPFRLSTTSNGTHGGGVQYTSGWSDNGGGAGSDLISTFIVPANAPDVLYYYCQYHSGMGGQINIGGTQGTYVQITGGSGVVAGIGTFPLGKLFSSSLIQTTSTLACAASIGQTYYHNGAGSAPVASNICYSDACKSTVLGNGFYKISSYRKRNVYADYRWKWSRFSRNLLSFSVKIIFSWSRNSRRK